MLAPEKNSDFQVKMRIKKSDTNSQQKISIKLGENLLDFSFHKAIKPQNLSSLFLSGTLDKCLEENNIFNYLWKKKHTKCAYRNIRWEKKEDWGYFKILKKESSRKAERVFSFFLRTRKCPLDCFRLIHRRGNKFLWGRVNGDDFYIIRWWKNRFRHIDSRIRRKQSEKRKNNIQKTAFHIFS